MGSYFYLVCPERKKYLCLGKNTGEGLAGYQGIYSDAMNTWISDQRANQCVANFILRNAGCTFSFDIEDNISELDEYDEVNMDELLIEIDGRD